MAIVYPLVMPAMPPGPKQITLVQNFIVAENDSPFTAQAQIYEHQGSWWSAKIDMPFLTRAQAAPWLAFLAALNGRSGTFLFGDPTIAAPLGNPVGWAVNGSGQTGKTLVCSSSSGTLKAGDYFQIGGENRLLWSQAFDNVAWILNQVTRPTADTIVDPAGNTTAEAILPTGSPTDCWIAENTVQTGGQTLTFSVWLRVPSGTKTINIAMGETAGALTTHSCALTTAWQRFSVTRTMLQTNILSCFIGGGLSWTAGEVDAWGAQLEPGPTMSLDYFATTATVQASNRRLHMSLGDATGNPCTLDIFPRLRESPITGISAWNGNLVFVKPQGQFRLDSNIQPCSIDAAGIYSISFGVREAF
jgi:hypothetical protein